MPDINGMKDVSGMKDISGIQDIHDIRPPVQVGLDPVFLKVALIILILAALGGLVFFLYRYFKRKKTRPNSTLLSLPAPLPPREAALKDLESLGDLMTGNPRLYYFRLTEIMKRFAGKIFNVGALEMNTQEFMFFLKETGLDRELFSDTRQFLFFSDTIKYAGMTPSHQVLEEHLAFVKNFVNKVAQTDRVDMGQGDRHNV